MDSAVLENQFLNFYESWTTDFRDASIRIGAQTYAVSVDQHVTWEQFIVLFNSQVGGGVQMQNVLPALDDGKRILQC
jgi:hypothetical protein